MADVETAPKRFPPFEETLQRIQVPASGAVIAMDATLGRNADAMAATIGLFGASAPRDPLPGLSIDLRAENGSARDPERQGLPPDYQIVQILGQGGMGQVHLAAQRSLAREVAIKTVHPGSSATAEAALCEEARITGQVEHPSVIPVHALGRSLDGRPVMVMKRVEGVSWKTLLEEPNHPLLGAISGQGWVAHLQILVQVGQAVAFAHSRGIVHRDLKPENVMIGRFGEVFVVDWGLAVKTSDAPSEGAHPIVGTPAYMAPEMVAGFQVDERTDVYLLGGILHEILTGAPPHEGETLMNVLAAAYSSAPKDFGPEVPQELAELCNAALARDPADRPASAGELRDALVHYLHRRPSIALAHRAKQRLDDLGAHDLARVEDRQAIRRALIECRFAFQQALTEWPENPAAREGLERCLVDAVRLEIAEGYVGAAKIALEELASPPEALLAEIAALEARLAAAEAEAERLRRLDRDMDTSVGATARKRAAWGIAALGAIVSAMAVRRIETGTMTPADLVRIAAFMVTSMGVIIVGARRFLLRNAFSRKIAYLALFASVSMFAHRALASWAGQALHVILAIDSLIFSVMLVVSGITLASFIGYGAFFTFAGAIAALAFPRWAPVAFSASTLSMLVAAALLFRPEPERDTTSKSD